MKTSLSASQRPAPLPTTTRGARARATRPSAAISSLRSSSSASAVASGTVLPRPPLSTRAPASATTAERAVSTTAAASRQEQEEKRGLQLLLQQQKAEDAAAVSGIIELVSSPSSGPRGSKGLSPEAARDFDAAVSALETSPRGVRDPASSPLLAGRWKLLFTTRPGTSSPIQRAFTGVEAFSVHQEVTAAVVSPRTGETLVPGSVTNVVTLGNAGTLRVVAATSTAAAPSPGFTPRRGPGAPFLKFLGTSSVAPPRSPGERLDFAFRKAAFYFTSGVTKGLSIPYPVPFETISKFKGDLGDEVKGFLDTTYLSPDGNFRLSRGNKGTLFVLQREEGTKRRLMDARKLNLSAEEVERAAAELSASGAGEAAPAKSPLALGKWRLAWSEQAPDAAPLQKALAGRVANWQVIGSSGGGESEKGAATTPLSNVVSLVPGLLDVVATATCVPFSNDRTLVDIDGLELRTLGGKARLLRIDRTGKTESDTRPAFFPESRRKMSEAEKEKKKTAAAAAKTNSSKSKPAAAAKKKEDTKKENNNVGFVDWLYLDADVRVTRGSKGSLFVHTRDV